MKEISNNYIKQIEQNIEMATVRQVIWAPDEIKKILKKSQEMLENFLKREWVSQVVQTPPPLSDGLSRPHYGPSEGGWWWYTLYRVGGTA